MISAAAKHAGKSKPGRKTKPWSTPALRDAIKQRYTLIRTVQSNRVEYLAACGEVRRLSEEARRNKWEEFLADLEGNPDPARARNFIKSLSGSPHSTAFCEPLIHNDRTFLTNSGKANAFVQQYAAVNRLSFDKPGHAQDRHLKKALKLRTAPESCCSPFTIRELDIAIHAMRRKGAVGPDDIPLPFSRHSAQRPRLNCYPTREAGDSSHSFATTQCSRRLGRKTAWFF